MLKKTTLVCILRHRWRQPQAEQKSVTVLDKKICEALTFADEVVDAKKDETIEGIVSVKKAVNALGPVQSVVVRRARVEGAACQILC